jgi:hypothetical protein
VSRMSRHRPVSLCFIRTGFLPLRFLPTVAIHTIPPCSKLMEKTRFPMGGTSHSEPFAMWAYEPSWCSTGQCGRKKGVIGTAMVGLPANSNLLCHFQSRILAFGRVSDIPQTGLQTSRLTGGAFHLTPAAVCTKIWSNCVLFTGSPSATSEESLCRLVLHACSA